MQVKDPETELNKFWPNPWQVEANPEEDTRTDKEIEDFEAKMLEELNKTIQNKQ